MNVERIRRSVADDFIQYVRFTLDDILISESTKEPLAAIRSACISHVTKVANQYITKECGGDAGLFTSEAQNTRNSIPSFEDFISPCLASLERVADQNTTRKSVSDTGSVGARAQDIPNTYLDNTNDIWSTLPLRDTYYGYSPTSVQAVPTLRTLSPFDYSSLALDSEHSRHYRNHRDFGSFPRMTLQLEQANQI